jgi:hypothetical protein
MGSGRWQGNRVQLTDTAYRAFAVRSRRSYGRRVRPSGRAQSEPANSAFGSQVRTANKEDAFTGISDFGEGPVSTPLRSDTPECSVSAMAEGQSLSFQFW